MLFFPELFAGIDHSYRIKVVEPTGWREWASLHDGGVVTLMEGLLNIRNGHIKTYGVALDSVAMMKKVCVCVWRRERFSD